MMWRDGASAGPHRRSPAVTRLLREALLLSAVLSAPTAIIGADVQWTNSRSSRWESRRPAQSGATAFSSTSLGGRSSGTGQQSFSTAPAFTATSSNNSATSAPPHMLPSSTAAAGGTIFSPFAVRTSATPITSSAARAGASGYAPTRPSTRGSGRQGQVVYPPSVLESFAPSGTSPSLSPSAPAWAPRPAVSSSIGTSGLTGSSAASARPQRNTGTMSPSSSISHAPEMISSGLPPSSVTSAPISSVGEGWRPSAPGGLDSRGGWNMSSSPANPSSLESSSMTRVVPSETFRNDSEIVRGVGTWSSSTLLSEGARTGAPWTSATSPSGNEARWTSSSGTESMTSSSMQSQPFGTFSGGSRSVTISSGTHGPAISRGWIADDAPVSSIGNSQGESWTTRPTGATPTETRSGSAVWNDSRRDRGGSDGWASRSGREGADDDVEPRSAAPLSTGRSTNWTSPNTEASSSGNTDRWPWAITNTSTFSSTHFTGGARSVTEDGPSSLGTNSGIGMPAGTPVNWSSSTPSSSSAWDAPFPDIETSGASATSSSLAQRDRSDATSFLPGTNTRHVVESFPALERAGPPSSSSRFSARSEDGPNTGAFGSADSSRLFNQGETRDGGRQQVQSSRDHEVPVPTGSTQALQTHTSVTRGSDAVPAPPPGSSGSQAWGRLPTVSSSASQSDTRSSPLLSPGTEGSMDFLSGSYQVNRASDSMTSVYPPAVSSQPSSRPFDGPVTSTPESQRSVRDNNPSEPLVPLSMSGAEPHATRPSEGLLPSNGVTEAHTGVPRTEAEEPLSAYSGRSNDVEDSAVSFLHDEGSVTPQATMSGPPTSAAPSPGSQADKDDMTGFPRGGYIPPSAVFSAEPSGRASARGGRGNPRQESSEPGALLYGDLDDYLENAKDPYASQLAALSRGADKERTVTATSTTPPYTYSPTYNPYSDNIDVDQIPDSPYHNYAYAEDPFPSPYSTHSRLENYGTEFNNRYYHEQRISPNISWNEYTRRKKEADEARKREEQLQQEGRIGVLEAADSSFQGLIGFPYEPRRRTNRTSRS